jgi:hypothetical protein
LGAKRDPTEFKHSSMKTMRYVALWEGARLDAISHIKLLSRLIIRFAAADQRELTRIVKHCKRECLPFQRIGRTGKAGIADAVGTREGRLDDPLLTGAPKCPGLSFAIALSEDDRLVSCHRTILLDGGEESDR